MKNADNVNFLQVNNQIKKITAPKGVMVRSGPQAWQEFKWTRKWFTKKPKEGYFIWVREQIEIPLSTCMTISKQKIIQDLNNLLVVEKGLKIKAGVICDAQKNNLCGRHQAKGKLWLKQGASLEYNHSHQWGNNDFVNSDYQFILEANSQLIYRYRNLLSPRTLKLKTEIHCAKNSSVQLELIVNGLRTEIKMDDTIYLDGVNSQGITRIRLVGKAGSQIEAKSRIVANAAGKGHLDCQGLILDKQSTIDLLPELLVKNKGASLTHEASIGKISEDQLNYLRSRGLTENEAVDLIVTGFLGKKVVK